MLPVEVGQPCSDAAGSGGLFISEDDPTARSAVPVRDPQVRPTPTGEKTTICLFMSGPRSGQARNFPMGQVDVGQPCGDAAGSLGLFISPNAPQARLAYRMTSMDDRGGPPPLRPGRTTICTYTSGAHKGQTEDWKQVGAPVAVGQPCDDGAGSHGFFIPADAPQARTAALRTNAPPSTPKPVPPQPDPGGDPTVALERTTVCHFVSGPRLGQTQDWKGVILPVEVGQPCSDAAGSLGLFISEDDPKARSAVPVSNPLARPAPTGGKTTVCLFMSGPRSGQARNFPIGPVDIGQTCGDAAGSLGLFISPNAPQALSAYRMTSMDDRGGPPSLRPGRSTICTYTSGARKGATEDWKELVSSAAVATPCDDGAGSLGFFVAANAPQARNAVPKKSWSAGPPHVATPGEWDAFMDSDKLIHSIHVEPDGKPTTGNGLLYTAYACVAMQMSGVSYDRALIASAVDSAKVRIGDRVVAGLFNRSRQKLGDQNAHDDYWGLAAMSALCGYGDLMRDILAYGRGPDQPSGTTVLGLHLENFGSLEGQVRQCARVLYNYNNVDPGHFTLDSWFGRYPSMVTHWKIANGEKPSPDEFALWAASLLADAATAKHGDTNPWLLGWIQVLTYQMSRNHSAAADFAVAAWWKLLHARYPDGGVKQAMKDHLAAEAPKNPLAKYVDNFENARNPSVAVTGSSENTKDLLDQVGKLLTDDCGPGNPSCLKLSDFSPTNFLAPFSLAEDSAERQLNEASRALELQDSLIANQAAEVAKAADIANGLEQKAADLTSQYNALYEQYNDFVRQKADMVARGLNQIQIPGGHWQSCPLVLCGPFAPPVWVPDFVSQDNPAFNDLINKLNGVVQQINNVASQINDANNKLQEARRDLTYKRSIEALRNVQSALQDAERKARGSLEATRGTGRLVRAIVDNLVPCMGRVSGP